MCGSTARVRLKHMTGSDTLPAHIAIVMITTRLRLWSSHSVMRLRPPACEHSRCSVNATELPKGFTFAMAASGSVEPPARSRGRGRLDGRMTRKSIPMAALQDGPVHMHGGAHSRLHATMNDGNNELLAVVAVSITAHEAGGDSAVPLASDVLDQQHR